MIKTQKWLHSTVPSKAGIDTRSSGPHFGRHLQFYYLIKRQKSRIQGSFVPNNTKKPKILNPYLEVSFLVQANALGDLSLALKDNSQNNHYDQTKITRSHN